MMTSYFNLLKYAATGQASPDMTYYDRMRASTLMGGATVQSLTGQPPLSFPSDGSPITIWSMIGNGSQTGTPSPQSIIVPELVGVRTGNLWNEDYTGISTSLKYVPVYVGNADVTMSTTCQRTSSGASIFLLSGNVSSGAATNTNGVWAKTGSYAETSRTASPIDGYVTVAFRTMTESGREYTPVNANSMLNSGSTALPYEPYGYKIPLTCAGQTVPVYLGQTQTVRRIKKLALTGEETVESGSTSVYIQRSGMLAYSAAVCTHYQYYDGLISGAPDMSIATGSGAGTSFWFKDSRYGNDAAAFKSYLAAQYAAGTPVTIWYVLETEQTGITNEPLCKIGTYADELHSEDASVSIPTVKGSNTLTVDTPIQPSEMTITYKG